MSLNGQVQGLYHSADTHTHTPSQSTASGKTKAANLTALGSGDDGVQSRISEDFKCLREESVHSSAPKPPVTRLRFCDY